MGPQSGSFRLVPNPTVPCGSAGLGQNLLRKVLTRPEGSEGSCSWVRVCTWPLHMAGRYRRGPELIGPFRTRPEGAEACIWPEHMAQSITGRYRSVSMDRANGRKVPKRAHGSCTWSEGAEKLVHVHASTDPGRPAPTFFRCDYVDYALSDGYAPKKLYGENFWRCIF